MDICEVVSSIRNKNKINVHGYLMVKDKKETTHITGQLGLTRFWSIHLQFIQYDY
jgi:hypothetical protein